MPERSYNQYCAIAHALDIVGERWTLLLIRELLVGPRRFSDLLADLPGIGSNLLAARLKHLAKWDIVRRETLPAPAASSVYTLTELGRGLEPVIVELHRWGSRTQGPPGPGTRFRPAWTPLAMRLGFDPSAAAGVHETYEFRVGADVFHAEVRDGAVRTAQTAAERPDVVISTDAATFSEVAMGRIDLAEAVRSGAAVLDGDREALLRCASLFGLSST